LVNASSGAKPFQLGGSNTGANEFAGVISNGTGGGTISFINAGTWILSGANTYTGKTTISAGTLSINSIQNASSVTGNSLGTPGVGANSIIDIASTGTLRYIGTGHSSDRVINLTTAAGGTFTLNASGPSGTFALTGGVTNAGTSGTSTVALTGTGLGSQSGSIVNGTSTNVAAVTKSGAGTWTLSGANTYTGATTVSGGKLLLGQGGSMAATAVSVTGTGTYGTAYTSSGNTIAGGKSLNLASGTKLDLQDNNTNTMRFTSTGALNGAGLYFDLGATTADKVEIMGAATVTNTNTFYFNVLGGSLATGTHAYTLIGAVGGLSGAGTFVIDPALTLTDYTLALDRDAVGVYLNVTANRIPGDADNNKVVDAADFIALKKNFGTTGLWAQGNFSDPYGIPGTVDWNDLNILTTNFGTSTPPAPAVTPEPATLGLLMVGALAVIRRNRRS
jgi:autotransporter-associated beta strand protein